eukprot:4980197-Amphidinium_carterae.2
MYESLFVDATALLMLGLILPSREFRVICFETRQSDLLVHMVVIENLAGETAKTPHKCPYLEDNKLDSLLEQKEPKKLKQMRNIWVSQSETRLQVDLHTYMCDDNASPPWEGCLKQKTTKREVTNKGHVYNADTVLPLLVDSCASAVLAGGRDPRVCSSANSIRTLLGLLSTFLW